MPHERADSAGKIRQRADERLQRKKPERISGRIGSFPSLTLTHTSCLSTLVIIRCGDRRFLSHKTAFDAVLGFILASMLARAVNGSAAFFPTLGGGFVLVMLHRALASWACRSHTLGYFIKGRSDALIRDGTLDHEVATRSRLSEHDVLEDLRLHGNVRGIADVSIAVFERNGEIGVVPRES